MPIAVALGGERRTFIGDVHGKFGRYSTILKNTDCPTIQVGDMGVGFYRQIPGDLTERPDANPPYDRMVSGGHRFIRGNHDNPGVCRKHTQWIPDGHVETIGSSTVMFIGGAWSIDFAFRTEGLSFWRDEELSTVELDTACRKYQEVKPDVVVTHDAPQSVVRELFISGTHKPLYASRTGGWLDVMFGLHKPKLWVFGHWHVSAGRDVLGCRFVCLSELETLDVDL
jgi:calcineurin-like phosphoesterase family protein